MADSKYKCCALVSVDDWHSRPHGVTATVERNGKWYCRTHDPVAMKEKATVRDDKYVDDAKKREAARSRAVDCAKACAGLDNPVEALKQAREALVALKNSVANLVSSIEQHHATTMADTQAIFAAATREYKTLDIARSAIEALTPKGA